jgi:hypothetical protein
MKSASGITPAPSAQQIITASRNKNHAKNRVYSSAQYNAVDSTMMQVPWALVPKVEELIAQAS